MKKPFSRERCIHEIHLSLCGMVFSLRTDSHTFLGWIRRLLFDAGFDAAPGSVSGFVCYCATYCDAPWILAIETPGCLHVALPHPDHNAGYTFYEWSQAGYHLMEELFLPPVPAVETTADTRVQILVAYVCRRLLRTLTNRHSAASLKVLHAAALEHNQKGLLIMGDSRCGKSTLTLACILAGMKYVSEEFSVIDIEQKVIIPLPTPIRLRAGTLALLPSFRNLPHKSITDMEGDVRWLVEPDAISKVSAGDTVRLSHILLLQGRAPHPVLTPAGGADTARACTVADIFAGGNDTLDNLWQWAGLMQGVISGYLCSGPLDETVALVREWMEESTS